MTYSYAICICGWRDEPVTGGTYTAADLLAQHRPECRYQHRALLVAMWSVAWPWYHSEESQSHRAGGPTPPFGLEMSWRPVGTHSISDPFSPYKHGGMAKEWYLFPSLEEALPGLAALDRLSARIKELEAEIERLRERSGIHD